MVIVVRRMDLVLAFLLNNSFKVALISSFDIKMYLIQNIHTYFFDPI